MLVPLSDLKQNDVVALFTGPQFAYNYAGASPASCSITLTGTATVRLDTNVQGIDEQSTIIPNPNTWTSIREVRGPGLIQIFLTPLSVTNWYRVIVLATGSGDCQISASWKTPADVVDPLVFQGTWNAAINNPTIISQSGFRGAYYVVSRSGSSFVDGITDWQIGDHIMFNGSNWIKRPNLIQTPFDPVTSIAGKTGNVILETSDIVGLDDSLDTVSEDVLTLTNSIVDLEETTDKSILPIGTGSNQLLPVADSGMVMVKNPDNSDVGVYLIGGSTTIRLGTTLGTWVAPTTSPAGGTCSIQYDAGNYRLYNNYGSSQNFIVIQIRTTI